MLYREMEDLTSLSLQELEQLKIHLEALRNHIRDIQNSRSLLLRLPGEIRNMICLYAMYAELHHRKECGLYQQCFREPALFAACRLLQAECRGVWYSEVIIWEEFDAVKKEWQVVAPESIRNMLCQRSSASQRALFTQPVHCTVERTRQSVVSSRTICPRMGIVRVRSETDAPRMPQVRWWMRS